MKFGIFILSVLSVKSALACGESAESGYFGELARELDVVPWSKESLEGNYET